MLPVRNYGETIEEYEVQHLLGKGGFASVYKARCRRTYQDVAIKMIDKKLIHGTGLSSRVRQEVEIHSRLKHPSVLQLYTFFQDANYVYLVLELAHNGELHRYMNQQMSHPFTEADAATILQQVVAGLLYLHSHNIMHRDISLSNLLLSKDMHVKIADFGLATQLKRPDEKHMTMCGTPNFISPEVVSRLSHGLAADVWSVGCLLYTLVVGRPPFDTDAVQSTLNKVVMSEFIMPTHLSFEACDLIEKLLKKNPHERISLEQVLRHPFMSKISVAADEPQYNSPKPGACDFYMEGQGQSVASGDSGIVTFASNESRNSQRLRSIEKSAQLSSNPQILPQIQEEYGYWQPPIEHKQYPIPLTSDNAEWERLGSKGKQPHTGSVLTEEQQIRVPPLNTIRLQPTRYKTKNAIMSILRHGEVVLEFVKFRSKLNEDRVTDICRISGDGRRIIIYQPDPGRGLPIREQAPPPESHIAGDKSVYNYDSLPSKHWKKYLYAARFVGLVKSKTPKITYFSSLAKCHLMENMIDFEMSYYSGAKYVKSSPGEELKLYNNYGMLLSDLACPEAKKLIDHGNECFTHCINICNALELAQQSADSRNTCFPVTIGRRPLTDVPHSQRFDGLRDTTNIAYSTPKSHQGSINFSMSTISSVQNGSESVPSTHSHASRAQIQASQQNVPIKRINIPDVGIATELSHGIVQVQFYDGSMISLIPEIQGGGLTYTQCNGVSTYFPKYDGDLPLAVRDRLAQIPQVKLRLKCAPLLSNHRKVDNIAMTPKSTTPSTPCYNRIVL
ncbi:serine/threonine-protein kinase PLK4 [Drosophila tropicalis]|uniref:serine/threonine-protein kinase PLK4 n=1 Tax=Drosophila tropicalis TaxID=46794 RepID=UPI0035ABAA02